MCAIIFSIYLLILKEASKNAMSNLAGVGLRDL